MVIIMKTENVSLIVPKITRILSVVESPFNNVIENILGNYREIYKCTLTLFRMGLFGAAHGWGGGGLFAPPLPKIRQTYPTIMTLGTVIPFPRKIQKMYKSRDTSLELC